MPPTNQTVPRVDVRLMPLVTLISNPWPNHRLDPEQIRRGTLREPLGSMNNPEVTQVHLLDIGPRCFCGRTDPMLSLTAILTDITRRVSLDVWFHQVNSTICSTCRLSACTTDNVRVDSSTLARLKFRDNTTVTQRHCIALYSAINSRVEK